MRSECYFLDVQEPDGNKYTIKLEQDCLTVGRSNGNDIVLPNPDKTISRDHCVLKCEANCWCVIDESSANGTFVQQWNDDTRIDVRQYGRLQLNNGDVILILGKKLLEGEEPVFWRLTFRDSDKTEGISGYQLSAYIDYCLSQQKLFLVNGSEREEIHLTRNERNLIHYMAERNQANNNQPVVCEYQELITAIWGDSFGHTNNEVTHLIWVIRQKVESDSGEPEFLITEKARGYSLKVKLIA
ncbi:MAG: FHA domain-containing protein [Brasilonema octagenarum HA4186-MV1]|jgi:DNA-binding winged helix-turn-helix (wHTH) protein|uniref:Forkhead-associated protein n=2 Tax=Brasilonema TaxID=383614 RepID=A0A856MC00_9CYAN|nr:MULTISPECIES: FHA domain-containing protein [Brasilonema]MBW4626896.1 FHA domain-containing protein [Brasilonema octagenarum HA4186-MV1]NMF66691.1 Forkhead-associated protein [Brasilonema octagenarum UFV-OR1]QDL07884.1 Forkhead-associated protein [Brasilonema sennae CENA114]QDL14244.1 Forkhead-associated protein [Brasilonema octagenarum UFV-E1]